MKKLNKLFAILFAVLGVQTLSAQKDVTDTYLKNAGFEDGTNYWTYGGNGTHYGGVAAYGSSTTYNSVTLISVDKFGESKGNALHTSAGWGSPSFYTQEVTLPAGSYKLTFDVINCNNSATRITNRFGWVPNSGTAIYSSVSDIIYNAWQTISVIFTLNTETTGKISVGMVSTSGSGSGAVAKLFTDNVRIFKMDEDSEATIAKPIDYSDLINQSTWSYAEDDGSGSSSSLTTNVNKGEWPYRMVERYRGAGGHYGKKLYQTISLPSGVYQVQAACMSAHANGVEGGNALPDGTLDNAYFYANDEEVTYALANATSTFQKNIVTLDNDGTIEFGVKTVARGANWNAIGCATVIKVANSYEEYLQDLLGELYTERLTLISKLEALQSEIPEPYYSNTVSPAIEKANNATTQETLTEANNALKNILTNAEKMVEPYASLESLIEQCDTYASNSYSSVQDEAQRTAFTTAIEKASNNGNNATTVAELTEVYNTLETARQTFVLAAYPTSGNSFDMTFKITNPSFETGDLTGWTIVQPSSDTGVKPNSNATYATTGVDGKYLFNTYWQGVPIKQTLAELPTGTYTLTVAVASDGCTVYLTADDEHSEGQMTSDKTQFIDTSIEFLCTDGETTIGVVGGADGDAAAHKEFTENGYWWYKADNFRLTRAFDASTLQNSLSSLKATAAELLTELMEPGKKSNLQAAHDNANTTSDNPFDLGDWSLALEKAIAEAQSSINDYAKIQEYINKTKVFVDESEVATYQTKHDNCEYTAADVENVRQELNVMRFNAASLVFPNKYEVTGWTGDLANGIRSDQHWSGNTQSYYDANSWTANFVGLKHTLSTTITLPNGAYVLKAAGRSSSDATLRLTIKNGDTVLESVEYTGKGDTGYGITINGCASFSADSTYANNDAGRGWEWEFAKFELDAETTVTLHVEVDYNNIQNRFGSFSDITLWMDDATYVTVYGKEIDAPLAEAKTLVNTLPMGTDENTALANAIAVGEGELSGPAALNAAVDGLKTAVVNANTWRNTYYTEKDKLVAALERFEADYNDAQNGALDYMCKSRWSTVITEAKEAAVAKDDRTSHAGLTTATEELIAALDAATVSVGEYADLKAAIETADPLYNGGNWGDQPFQRPTSEKESLNTTTAQNTYNAATADGEAVISLTEALKNGCSIELNAPEEGDVFELAIQFAGWQLNDKPLTLADNGTGGISIFKDRDANYYAQTMMLKKVEGNKYTISSIAADGTERYVSTGKTSGVGDNTAQIRLTDDVAKALSIEVIPTATEGLYNLKNTEANALLGCQDDKAQGGLYTCNVRNNFTITKVDMPSVTLKTPSYWATLILPFAAEIPDGLVVYSCTDAAGNELTLTPVDKIVANTPYLVCGQSTEFEHTFKGFGSATTTSYTEGLFTGTYVDYNTTADGKTYVLQKKDGEVAFYLVGESAQPTVKPNRIYMSYEAAAGAPVFRINRVTTTIEGTELDAQGIVPIYDLMGRRVTTMEKGGMYIINGKKIIIK